MTAAQSEPRVSADASGIEAVQGNMQLARSRHLRERGHISAPSSSLSFFHEGHGRQGVRHKSRSAPTWHLNVWLQLLSIPSVRLSRRSSDDHGQAQYSGCVVELAEPAKAASIYTTVLGQLGTASSTVAADIGKNLRGSMLCTYFIHQSWLRMLF